MADYWETMDYGNLRQKEGIFIYEGIEMKSD